MNLELIKWHEAQKNREALEHRDLLLAISQIITTTEGRKLFKYLFKHFDVAGVPDRSLTGEELHEYLGFLRAGNSIFKIACEASHLHAGDILAKLEREKYERLVEQHRIENGFTSTTEDGASD